MEITKRMVDRTVTPLKKKDVTGNKAITATWQPGTMIRDNHGIALPDALPAGHYELWLAVYWWQEPNNRLPVTDDTGELLGDHVVLTTITVN